MWLHCLDGFGCSGSLSSSRKANRRTHLYGFGSIWEEVEKYSEILFTQIPGSGDAFPVQHPSAIRLISAIHRQSGGERVVAQRNAQTESELRRDLIRVGKWLSRLGFMPGTSGNLSVRLDQDRVLATPTGIGKNLLRCEDVVVVDLGGRQ